MSAGDEAMPRRAFVEQVMGLPVSIHVRGPSAAGPAVALAVAQAYAWLRADEALFSTWRADSEVSRIRRGDLALADAHPRVREVADLCDEAYERTGGAFSAWLPGPDGVRRFDPTGLVKGWAAEQAYERLVGVVGQREGHDVLVNAGGDVVLGCGRTDTADWVVGIEDPADRTRMVRTFTMRAGAVATSGTAARGAHLIDPATGRPAGGLRSATVVGPSLTWADAYATAAFVKGPAALEWIGAIPGYAAVLVTEQGAVLNS